MKPKTNKGRNKKLEEYGQHYQLVTNLYKELYTDYNGLNEEQLLNNEEKILHEIIAIITKTISITKKGDEIESIILSIDSERERVSLGIKQLASETDANNSETIDTEKSTM